ncbi:MAG: DNA alkylation repair protein [Deefgea sp.]
MLARYLAEYQHQLYSANDPKQAEGMSAYMKHQFAFIGIPAPQRRNLVLQLERAAAKDCTEPELLELAQALWLQPEREFQLCAIDLLVRSQHKLTAHALPTLEQLICSQSWWDSVDTLASKVVGPIARREPLLIALLDQWQTSPHLWLRRTAIIYQLGWKTATDETRLWQACRVNAADADFFIRKAIGWALRQYARTAPDKVRHFVEQTPLSALSRREALKHCNTQPNSDN